MNDLSLRFAANAKAVMKKNGMTVADLVADDLPQSTIYRMLRGDSEPTLANALVMADALCVTLNRLIKA